jgi:splicing factor 3B subunit 1
MGKDYIYAVTPLLEDALMDRDLVHRQTTASALKHMALGVAGLGCEDALIHLLNFVWPNILETSPHVINAVMEAIKGMRVALGPAILLSYCLQVCSILRGKCEKFTGGFTTRCTLVHKMV